jgi:hypothetical protein
MTNLKMVFYSEFDGVETRFTWPNEEVYQEVKSFLEGIGVQLGAISGNGPPEGGFGYIEIEEQYDALCDFTHKLKAKEQL